MNNITYGFNLKVQLFMYDESVVLSFFRERTSREKFFLEFFQERNLCVN